VAKSRFLPKDGKDPPFNVPVSEGGYLLTVSLAFLLYQSYS
jgi:hypothetical protein